MRGIARSPSHRPAVLLLALPLLFSAVLAIGVQIQPDLIKDGGPISITLSNVTDGYTLNMTLVAAFAPLPGISWLNFTNWDYPFALNGGKVTVRGQNVERITLIVRSGSTIKSAPPTPGTGDITVELPIDIPESVYHDFRIGYEVHNTSAPLMIALVQQGRKTGSMDAILTPSIIGVKEGNLTVKILANGTLQGSKEIRILETLPLPTPTEGNATATQTPASSPSATPPPGTSPTTSPPPRTSVPTPPASPPATTTPVSPPASPASPEGGFPWIVVYVAFIIIVAILADYLILKD
ncbi:MAG: hypothetical protein LUO97_00915 [Methanomicrobiales archaeon]|nr:hypothetical protein [Methanomicrobiales archaeon]